MRSPHLSPAGVLLSLSALTFSFTACQDNHAEALPGSLESAGIRAKCVKPWLRESDQLQIELTFSAPQTGWVSITGLRDDENGDRIASEEAVIAINDTVINNNKLVVPVSANRGAYLVVVRDTAGEIKSDMIEPPKGILDLFGDIIGREIKL